MSRDFEAAHAARDRLHYPVNPPYYYAACCAAPLLCRSGTAACAATPSTTAVSACGRASTMRHLESFGGWHNEESEVVQGSCRAAATKQGACLQHMRFAPKPDAGRPPALPCRYLCTTCEAAGTNFNLCERCWDRHQEQQQQQQRRQQAQPASSSVAGGGSSREASAAVHNVRHAFQHIGPRMTRHNDYYNNRGSEAGSDPANPWGRPRNGGASLQRALQRLGDRYGVRQWM
jgi:hypothetical protein